MFRLNEPRGHDELAELAGEDPGTNEGELRLLVRDETSGQWVLRLVERLFRREEDETKLGCAFEKGDLLRGEEELPKSLLQLAFFLHVDAERSEIRLLPRYDDAPRP